MAKISDKKYYEQWQKYRNNISNSTPVDINETATAKQKRIDFLENNPEKWFKYYFPNFYTSEPAKFQMLATERVLAHAEWYEVRSWARELAKSARTMMEILYLTLTGKKKNVILVSNTFDNACRLLLPYKSILETNNRIISDYGKQESIGKWEAGEFTTKKGVSFRALGAGQSPRGTRNDSFRPDVILIDDIDTDEECRNKERITQKIKWIEEALIPTRSISNPLLLIVCGNIIAKYCCVVGMGEKADKWDIVNIRNKKGKSTWPEKNTEKDIDRALTLISYNSGQKEYFNNPIEEGTIFKTITYGKCPPLKSCEKIIIYADPATSNKDKGKSSTKGVGIIGFKKFQFFLYKIYLDNSTNATFVEWLYEAYRYCKAENVDTFRVYLENNSLQDPFYEQVIIPLINKISKDYGYRLPIIPDKRRKPDKFYRIEGTLEPLNRLGNLIFNEQEKDNPYMVRMKEQMINVSPTCKEMDGPDLLEGGVWLLQNRIVKAETSYAVGSINNRKY